MKDTHIFERLDLQFRAEIFNILNRANLNTPNLIVYTSAAGDAFSRGRNVYANLHNLETSAIRPEIVVVRGKWHRHSCLCGFLNRQASVPRFTTSKPHKQERLCYKVQVTIVG